MSVERLRCVVKTVVVKEVGDGGYGNRERGTINVTAGSKALLPERLGKLYNGEDMICTPPWAPPCYMEGRVKCAKRAVNTVHVWLFKTCT